jgi:hypothetical protein
MDSLSCHKSGGHSGRGELRYREGRRGDYEKTREGIMSYTIFDRV